MMGEIDYDEFMEYVGDTRSPFTDALMSLIDPRGTGIVTFPGFFQIIVTYCMYSQEDILRCERSHLRVPAAAPHPLPRLPPSAPNPAVLSVPVQLE